MLSVTSAMVSSQLPCSKYTVVLKEWLKVTFFGDAYTAVPPRASVASWIFVICPFFSFAEIRFQPTTVVDPIAVSTLAPRNASANVECQCQTGLNYFKVTVNFSIAV